ncbi:MAG: PIN domain-containing protein [archaeon]
MELKDFPELIERIQSEFEEQLLKVSFSNDQLIEAEKIAKRRNLPKGDVLHAILARDNKAVLISRDKHFQELLDIVEVSFPEEVTFD